MDQSDFYSGKRVLVTGATGLIGTNLIQELVEREALIRATIHVKEPLVEHKNISYVRCDLTRAEDCANVVEDIDCAFLCAANTSGAYTIASNALAHVTDNVIMNARMLEAAANVDRCLFLSSSTVYPPVDYAVNEGEAFSGDPHPSYFGSAWMKRYSEKLAQFYCDKYGRNIAVVRPTNVYGPFDKFDFETSHVLPALIRRAVERQAPFEVWGDGSAVRDFVYVSDLVEALLQAMVVSTRFEAFNVGSGTPVTIRESLETILTVAGYEDARVNYDPSKPTTIPIRLVDLTLAKRRLGFEAKVSLKNGLERTIEWYRQSIAAALT